VNRRIGIASAVIGLVLLGCKVVPPAPTDAPVDNYPFATQVTCGKALASAPQQVADFGRKNCDKQLERLGGQYLAENHAATEQTGLSPDHCLISNTGTDWVLAAGVTHCFPRMLAPGDIFAAVPIGHQPGQSVPKDSLNRKQRPTFFIELAGDRIWIYFPSYFNADMKSDAVVSTPVPTGTPPAYIPQYDMDTYLPGKDGKWAPNGNEPGNSMFYLFGASTDHINAVVVAFLAFLKGYEGVA
jgi:hypothetical protein